MTNSYIEALLKWLKVNFLAIWTSLELDTDFEIRHIYIINYNSGLCNSKMVDVSSHWKVQHLGFFIGQTTLIRDNLLHFGTSGHDPWIRGGP